MMAVMKVTVLIKTVWENMQNYKRQRENFEGSVGPRGAAKHVTEIVDSFYCFSELN
jgi:hypothetical protein